MKSSTCFASTLVAGVALAGSAMAGGEVLVGSDIAASETWTADNTYNLQGQIYVLPGATLTIEAGTVIASDAGGSLAVTRGAKIEAQGTSTAPITFTSKADVATWASDPSHPTGGDPTTGSWREAANEWGNLTVMGNGYISEDATPGNKPYPDAGNVANMEGLTAAFPGDPNVQYGGGDDDDDSGTLSYVNLRYGGKVIGLGNELNGLSLGGIGRGTTINNVEIMNNVDDGIEIWGGAVELEKFSIWNIGDDSLDFDQGWRGKAQYGLVVQGYSLDASQGSGVGDNACEHDGAEDSDYQPVSTVTLYNMTLIGQPVDGDGLTAWRDNAKVQYRSSIFMNCGEKVVRADNLDGDGAQGYGHNGTLSFADHWTTSAAGYCSTVNQAPSGTPSCTDLYKTQTNGFLCEIRDSVFFQNVSSSAYTEADARGVFDGTKDNVKEPALSPIASITRGAPVTKGGKTMVQVLSLDPRATNDASTSAHTADAGFDETSYRGAFDETCNWLAPWSTSFSFGFVVPPQAAVETVRLGSPANPNVLMPGSTSGPVIGQNWDPSIDHTTFLTDAAFDILGVTPNSLNLPVAPFGTILCDILTFNPIIYSTAPGANFFVSIPADDSLVGTNWCSQGISANALGQIRATNAIDFTIGCY